MQASAPATHRVGAAAPPPAAAPGPHPAAAADAPRPAAAPGARPGPTPPGPIAGWGPDVPPDMDRHAVNDLLDAGMLPLQLNGERALLPADPREWRGLPEPEQREAQRLALDLYLRRRKLARDAAAQADPAGWGTVRGRGARPPAAGLARDCCCRRSGAGRCFVGASCCPSARR
jgi:hypothetical protein